MSRDLPGAEDYQTWQKLKDQEPEQEKYVNLWTWWTNTFFFTDEVKLSWAAVKPSTQGKGKGPTPQKKAEPKKEEKHKGDDDDDEMDLFGSDEDEEVAAALKKKKEEAIAKAMEKAKNVVGKSMVVFDVKVWEKGQDLDSLAEKILKIELDGLTWGENTKQVEIAYGIKKLQVVCTIVDSLVSTEDLQEKIEEFKDEVQSVDIASFNKI